MAITITATPASYSSVHDDLIYTASSDKTTDPVTYPNYKFIGDVYVNGTLQARIKKIQDPVTGIGIFNIGQVVRNYLATVFNPGSGLLSQSMGSAEFFLTVQVKFGEEFNFTPTYDLMVDSARIFFNNYNGRLIGTTSSLAALANKVASSRPATDDVQLTSTFYFIPYFPSSSGSVSVTVTPTGGGSAYSTSFSGVANTMAVLNVAPAALNALQGGTINASTLYYTVQIGSQTYRLNVICEPIYTPYTIHFLNKFGGWESKVFSKVSRRQIDITKKDYGKIGYTVDGSGVVAYYNSNGVYNETRSTYAVQYNEKLTLNSDILTDAQYAWLEQLVLSPMVYVQDGAYHYPCIIKESNYEPKKVINDELTNLTLSVEFGNQLNAQFR
jgi:hypothetical protein